MYLLTCDHLIIIYLFTIYFVYVRAHLSDHISVERQSTSQYGSVTHRFIRRQVEFGRDFGPNLSEPIRIVFADAVDIVRDAQPQQFINFCDGKQFTLHPIRFRLRFLFIAFLGHFGSSTHEKIERN